MSGTVIVYKHRNNRITVNLGFALGTDTIVSEIRTQPSVDAPLVASWAVSVVDAPTGEILLQMNESVSGGIAVESGWMDFKRMSGGEPYPVIERPIEVSFVDAVTA